jgi:hypothetical protein
VDARIALIALSLVAFLGGNGSQLTARTRPQDRPLEHTKALVERIEKPRPA